VQFRSDVYDIDSRLATRLADRLERLRRTGEAAAVATTVNNAPKAPAPAKEKDKKKKK
jgi:hypothetical protein